MSIHNYLPLLTGNTYEALKKSVQLGHTENERYLEEFQIFNDAILSLREIDPRSDVLKRIEELRTKFTGSGGNVCPCCRRPFE